MKRTTLLVLAISMAAPLLSATASAQVDDRRACQLGLPRCVGIVIRQMDRRERRLERRCEHDTIFALLYLRTTETFEATLPTIGYGDPAGVVREDSQFAQRYFDAFDAYHEGHGYVPPAWQVAFDAARNRAVTSAGNTLLGMNAHIQRDLPFVLFDLYQQGHPISIEDHRLVNVFLAQVDVTDEIVDTLDPTFGDGSDPAAFFQLVVAWRELAFSNYERLRDAPTQAARGAVAAEIEGYAAAVASGIVLQTSYPPGTSSAARDAFCACHH